jgi:hypothetical protein
MSTSLAAAPSGMYEFSFLANQNADNSNDPGPPNHALDILYITRINASLIPAFNLSNLNKTSFWTSHAITTRMTFQAIDVTLNDAFNPATTNLSIQGGGLIEFFPQMSEFFCVDFNGNTPFVVNNNLPGDPFVFGQLDVYDNQPAFQDFYQLWVNGDTSRLNGHAVPEPSAALLFTPAVLLFTARRRRMLRSAFMVQHSSFPKIPLSHSLPTR